MARIVFRWSGWWQCILIGLAAIGVSVLLFHAKRRVGVDVLGFLGMMSGLFAAASILGGVIYIFWHDGVLDTGARTYRPRGEASIPFEALKRVEVEGDETVEWRTVTTVGGGKATRGKRVQFTAVRIVTERGSYRIFAGKRPAGLALGERVAAMTEVPLLVDGEPG